MYRRDLIRTGAAISVAGVAGCLGQSDNSDFTEGFEGGLSEWEAKAAIGPEVEIEDFEWEADVSETEAAEGEQSLRVWNEGDYDDGVTWVSHPIPVESGQAYQIEATGQFWTESESFNTIRHAVMRLGPEPAEAENDFPQLGVNSTEFGETPFGGASRAVMGVGWLAGVLVSVDHTEIVD